ncbi:hypothetical protein BpHYR1_047448 [Brachionus plicatilis]|uniref:Uncharacterized protein n=1 Tax=Brachionus plicatilis TaxID=10195 RepID=A0A3M7P4Z8_BRAPC|nr:hypothetical protein BpHYR1_047448 [Brachionus plicatilis]
MLGFTIYYHQKRYNKSDCCDNLNEQQKCILVTIITIRGKADYMQPVCSVRTINDVSIQNVAEIPEFFFADIRFSRKYPKIFKMKNLQIY